MQIAKEANTREGKQVCLIDKQSPKEAGWWDAPLAFRESAKAIPIISGNVFPLLTENNFQTPPPPSILFDPTPFPFIDI